MKLIFGSFLAIVVLLTLADGLLGRKQRVVVKGKVVCNSDPSKARNVKVKLVDEDDGLDPDDDMAETRTDQQGQFHLDGTETEILDIDPRVKIYHHCNGGINPCARKWKLMVPKSYITAADKQPKPFDMGVLNLEMIQPKEERDCVH